MQWLQDVKSLTEDIGELKPSIFCAVPRVLDRIYSGKLLARHFLYWQSENNCIVIWCKWSKETYDLSKGISAPWIILRLLTLYSLYHFSGMPAPPKKKRKEKKSWIKNFNLHLIHRFDTEDCFWGLLKAEIV